MKLNPHYESTLPEMADPITQATAQAGAQGQHSHEEVPLRRVNPKDMSLVSLVPKWSGMQSAIPVAEFFETIEATPTFRFFIQLLNIRQ
jgi:hypothetical protein